MKNKYKKVLICVKCGGKVKPIKESNLYKWVCEDCKREYFAKMVE